MALFRTNWRRHCRNTRTTRGEYRWTRGIHGPSEEKFGSRATDASLAGAHAAAGVQFGNAPRGMFSSTFERDILAAAEERVWLCQSCKLGAQRESILHCADHFPVTGARCEKFSRGIKMAGRGEAGNLTFYDRKLHPANPGGLARAEDTRLRGFL